MSVIKRKDNTEKILFERKKIDLTTPDDRLNILVFLISLAVCLVAGAVCLEVTIFSATDESGSSAFAPVRATSSRSCARAM